MLNFELDQEPRRLEDLDIEELEASIRRGRRLQARAIGHGLKALFAALAGGEARAAARPGQGRRDWDEVLGLAAPDPARGASR